MPLAGRPPYATDEPDSFYESAPPQPRVRQAPPPNPNERSSAYDVYGLYNHYLSGEHRQSGVGALGFGLMNMADDDDDDDDESHPKPPSSSPSKHAALAAATAKQPARRPSPPAALQPAIAAPKPGYAAPIAALNLARPEPATSPISMPKPVLSNPFADPNSHPIPQPSRPFAHQPSPASPSPSIVSNQPHPLQPPITPITPVFARPKPNIKFEENVAVPRPPKPIVRGQSEDTLLPSRGEKGDDFWRRFSMVAKTENNKSSGEKESMWLRKTQDGSTRLSRWVWVTGIVLLCIIGGVIGIAWHVSHNSPSNQAPTAIGGSANEAATAATTSSTSGVSVVSGSTIMHVSPTNTINGRELEADVVPTPAAVVPPMHRRRRHDTSFIV
ncbi:hypothetical protein H0H92_011262 [Tricholoma furcatifolium]|nr:hypothetical protein H0H92_011262 [Tricholoma furcatifolium]